MNGGYALSLGADTLPLGGRAVAAHPGVKSQMGRPIVVGIRSEALFPATDFFEHETGAPLR